MLNFKFNFYSENDITINQEAYQDSQSQRSADHAADRNDAFSGTEIDPPPTGPPPQYNDDPSEENEQVNDLNRRFRKI